MFDFFKGKEEGQPTWLSEMNDNRERWFTFLEKLEVRMNELGEAAIPELINTFNDKTDTYHQTWHNMASGIRGQYKSIIDKARDVREDKVNGFFNCYINQIKLDSKYRNALYDFRTACLDRENLFEESYHLWLAKINATEHEDLEFRYQQILNEYEEIKHQFTCKQCGGSLVIHKIFFISTYITCQHCQTQNTFKPSSQAQQLEHLGRSLAEQRTAHLLEAYNQALSQERDDYHQRHRLEFIPNTNQQQKDELENQRKKIIKSAPTLCEEYLRAMFNEWNKIVPDLSEQNERFYESQLRQFRKRNS